MPRSIAPCCLVALLSVGVGACAGRGVNRLPELPAAQKTELRTLDALALVVDVRFEAWDVRRGQREAILSMLEAGGFTVSERGAPSVDHTLAVTIDEITITRDYAVSCLIPEFGGLCGTDLLS